MDDWLVADSDQEDSSELLIPEDPGVIIKLYESIKRGEALELETKLYPRREADYGTIDMSEKSPADDEKVKTPEKQEAEATEFDFDTQSEDRTKRFTPRRNPNRTQPKKVATMSNVFSDIMKFKKLDDEQSKSDTTQ